jgi:hypothetical protein
MTTITLSATTDIEGQAGTSLAGNTSRFGPSRMRNRRPNWSY